MKFNELKDVINLKNLYNVYCEQLLSLASGIFEYSGFDDTIDTWQLEKFMILQGFVGVGDAYKNEIAQGHYVLNGSMSGATPYSDRFTTLVYANPVFDSKSYTINENVCMFYNTRNISKLGDEISVYALQLAQIAISLNLCIVNKRVDGVFNVFSDKQKDAVKDFYEKIFQGSPIAMTGNDMINQITNIELTRKDNNISEIIQAQNNIYRMFFRMLGIDFSKDKSQAILSDESESDNSALRGFIYPMLLSRRECVENYNKMFGKNVSVKLNDFVYNFLIKKESEENENEQEN